MNALVHASEPDPRVLRMVAGMAEIFGVTATAARLRGYAEALADVPVDALQLGIRRAITGWRYPDMPKPADIRASVDAARAVQPPPEDERDVPHFAPAICTRCDDNGWVCVAECTDRAAPTFKRCHCYTSNPKLVAPKSYAQEDRR